MWLLWICLRRQPRPGAGRPRLAPAAPRASRASAMVPRHPSTRDLPPRAATVRSWSAARPGRQIRGGRTRLVQQRFAERFGERGPHTKARFLDEEHRSFYITASPIYHSSRIICNYINHDRTVFLFCTLINVRKNKFLFVMHVCAVPFWYQVYNSMIIHAAK